MYEYDTSLVFFPLKLMQKYLNKTQLDHYEILVNDFDNLDNIKKKISNLILNILKSLIGGN